MCVRTLVAVGAGVEVRVVVTVTVIVGIRSNDWGSPFFERVQPGAGVRIGAGRVEVTLVVLLI